MSHSNYESKKLMVTNAVSHLYPCLKKAAQRLLFFLMICYNFMTWDVFKVCLELAYSSVEARLKLFYALIRSPKMFCRTCRVCHTCFTDFT